MEGIPKEDRPEMGLLVAGYSADSPFAQEWEFLLPRDKKPKEVKAAEDSGAAWRGVNFPFIRLWSGFDPTIWVRLQEAGVDEATIKAAIEPAQAFAVYDGMPVQDAIDFAVFILNTTVGYTTFIPGVPSCGGPLQVAGILPDEGFVWISRPERRAKPM